jgi:hypothetical protein
MHYEMVRKSIRSGGLHRFSGTNLFVGYIWLLISGVLMIFSPQFLLGYDAFVHAFFLGFTFSMIFAHGPIILPGLARLTYRPYHPFMYTWSVILQVSVLLRVATDLLELPILRQWSGLISTVAIVGYLGNLLYLIVRHGRMGK